MPVAQESIRIWWPRMRTYQYSKNIGDCYCDVIYHLLVCTKIKFCLEKWKVKPCAVILNPFNINFCNHRAVFLKMSKVTKKMKLLLIHIVCAHIYRATSSPQLYKVLMSCRPNSGLQDISAKRLKSATLMTLLMLFCCLYLFFRSLEVRSADEP